MYWAVGSFDLVLPSAIHVAPLDESVLNTELIGRGIDWGLATARRVRDRHGRGLPDHVPARVVAHGQVVHEHAGHDTVDVEGG